MTDFSGVITIDGRGTFKYTLEKIAGEAHSASTSTPVNVSAFVPPNGQRTVQTNDGEVVSVILLKHEMKSGLGKESGKPWEKHSFRASDNRTYNTFRNETAAQLTPLVGAGTPVKLVVKPNAYKSHDVVRVLGA